MPSAIQKLYLWGCHRLYRELAWAYDAVSWGVSAGQWSAWRKLALAHLPPDGPILEVGFGTGELLRELIATGREVYGVEPSRAMQRIAGRKLGSAVSGGAHPPLRVRALAQALPFPDAYFQGVVATFPAEYIFDRLTAVEIARVLAPGRAGSLPAAGRVVIGPFAVSVNAPRLAQVLRIFYGTPPQAFLDRWLATFRSAGLQPRAVQEPTGRATAWLVVADKERD